jgi:Dolichyl-phosphate-mannose-protein mannosyltransferase
LGTVKNSADAPVEKAVQPVPQPTRGIALTHLVYLLALLASISTWFLAIRTPLWLDETGSYWMINGSLLRIWSNRFISLCFPAYFYLLWLWTKLFGTSEVALRSLSIVAMLGAAWLLYLAARELFDRNTAFIAVILFCVHPLTIYEAVDVRPYAFVALATCLSIWLLLRLSNNSSLWLAALFGASAALPVWFHYLSATILPALLLAFFLVKSGDRRNLWRQLAVALAAFALAFLPLIPGILYLFHTAKSHVFESPPVIAELFQTLDPFDFAVLFISFLLLAIILAAFAPFPPEPESSSSGPRLQPLSVSAVLGLVPILILYGVSAGTSIHCFAPRHRMAATPGIALCWAWLASRLHPSILRLLFCLTVVAFTVYLYFGSPYFHQHSYSWKYALQAVEAQAAPTHSPVLICSDFPEADYARLPSGPANDNVFLAQLSYYKLTVPAYVLPPALNAQAVRIGSAFIRQAAQKHERFFAVAYASSYRTLLWLSRQAAPDFSVTTVGVYDYVKVLEFTPRPTASTARQGSR